MVSFDTELFGHWWFEGIEWLKHVIRKLHACEGVNMQTSSEYVESHPPSAAMELPESTWAKAATTGSGRTTTPSGCGRLFTPPSTACATSWPSTRRVRSAEGSGAQSASQRVAPAGKQRLAVPRHTFQAKDYAVERFDEHKDRFWALAEMLGSGNIDTEALGLYEYEDNPFPNIDLPLVPLRAAATTGNRDSLLAATHFSRF